MSSFVPRHGDEIKIGDFVVIEYLQRQYIAGEVEDFRDGYIFLKNAYESMPDASVYTYRMQFFNSFDIFHSDVLYTCEKISSDRAKDLKETIRLIKILIGSFPNTKEDYLFDVVKKIQETEKK